MKKAHRSLSEKTPEIMTVDMADSVDIIPGDVHIWLSPRIMAESSERIYRKLLRLYPENEELYRERYRALRRDIDSLDQELQKTFAPHRGKAFMHTAPRPGILLPGLRAGTDQYPGREQNTFRQKDHAADRIRKAREISG
ncbi:MAG: zinc ABC transporter substrate-binding protein [Candidatus Marinimicrobia bacterium]|nr:zinc ABC transporter substrate-binding protein [Candidatus Neomarinimicrobiota bacterium]